MAKIVPMDNIDNSLYSGKGYHSSCGYKGVPYGQLEIPLPIVGKVRVPGPILMRVSGRGIPDFTMDLEKPGEPSTLLSLINPKVTLLVGNSALQYQYDRGRVEAGDPKIFEKPTMFDQLQALGTVSYVGAIALGLVGVYFVYKTIKMGK